MLNPKVGLIVSIGSPLNFFKIVVFPALSKPLKIREMLHASCFLFEVISCNFFYAFLTVLINEFPSLSV